MRVSASTQVSNAGNLENKKTFCQLIMQNDVSMCFGFFFGGGGSLICKSYCFEEPSSCRQ